MVTIDFNEGFFEVKFELCRNSFNKELLKRICSTVFETKTHVVSILKSKSFESICAKINDFLIISSKLDL